MRFTLDKFEQQVNNTIFNRGKKYYKEGKVIDLLETSDGWDGVVAGSDEYCVEIIDSSQDLQMTCTCPYDMGPICKHQVAVLLTIKNGLIKQPITKKRKKKGISKAEKLIVKAQKIIDDFDLIKAKSVIHNFLHSDELSLEKFIAEHTESELDSSFYRKQIMLDLGFAKGKYGFIDYCGTDIATSSANDLLTQATEWQKQGFYSKVIPVAQAVIETMAKAIGNADDSNGEIGSCIELGFELLANSAPLISSDEQLILFDYLIIESQKTIYQGWDWRWEFLIIASKLVNDDTLEVQFFKFLDGISDLVEKYDFLFEYKQVIITEIEGDLIQRRHPEQYFQFLLDNKDVDSIRKKLISFYIKNKNLDEAKRECCDVLDDEFCSNQVDYLKLLLVIAQAQDDNKYQIDVATKLLIETGELKFYHLLKEIINKEDWSAFVEQLISFQPKNKDTMLQNMYFSKNVIAEILKLEGMWEKLMVLVESQDSFYLIDIYRLELEQRFKKRMFELYKTAIYQNLARVASRKNYQKQCRYLRRIKKLGFFKDLEEIVGDLKQKYPQRRALLEELSMI